MRLPDASRMQDRTIGGVAALNRLNLAQADTVAARVLGHWRPGARARHIRSAIGLIQQRLHRLRRPGCIGKRIGGIVLLPLGARLHVGGWHQPNGVPVHLELA
jgi:hypothetical protein